MAQANRGTKRRCAHCGAAFYDLDRTPIICPKCDTPYQPVAVLPRAPVRPARAARIPEPEIADAEDPEAFEEDEVLNNDVEDEDEVIGHDDEGETNDGEELRD